jgi:hypothetical protein
MSTDAYLDAKKAYEDHSQALRAFAATLRKVSDAIAANPGRFIISNVATGLPMSAMGGSSVNGDEWKSADQIQQMLLKWHQLRDRMLQAWESVPNDRKNGLVPPPGVDAPPRRY